ncbi:MAG TPA: metal-dependent hydrolase [Vicinamibacterales bacterium]|nr:metal-dependent hydrolase [Vicinamibacterales bacterium]
MDNVCHTLVGIAAARAGLQRKTAYATATAAIAANLPDLDVLVFATDMPSVAFRRGITHGAPAQLLLPIVCAAAMWWIGRRRPSPRRPVHFGWLLAISYVGVLSHVLLDLLNTYGVRLLSPMSQRWFYGDAVFIVDPWLWLMLGAGVLFARRYGARAAAVALTCATLYIGAMVVSARVARTIVHDAWIARTGEAPRALMVGPRPVTPFRKQIIVDAGDHYVAGAFRWPLGDVEFDPDGVPKNDDGPAVREARHDPDVRGFLVWSRFPFWQTRDVAGGTEVTVRDMRFKDGPAGRGFTVSVLVDHRR